MKIQTIYKYNNTISSLMIVFRWFLINYKQRNDIVVVVTKKGLISNHN